MVDFNPADVWLSPAIPLVDTFGSAELEHAAASIVLALQLHRSAPNTWCAVGWEDLQHAFVTTPLAWPRNPFFQPDFFELARRGFAVRHAHGDPQRDTIELTAEGLARLTPYVRPGLEFARENGRRSARASEGIQELLRTGLAVELASRVDVDGLLQHSIKLAPASGESWCGSGRTIAEAFMNAWCGPLVCSTTPPSHVVAVHPDLICDRCGLFMREHPLTQHSRGEKQRVVATCDGQAVVLAKAFVGSEPAT